VDECKPLPLVISDSALNTQKSLGAWLRPFSAAPRSRGLLSFHF